MDWERTEGWVHFRLTDNDWLNKQACFRFIDAVKEAIPARDENGVLQREYDKETTHWSVREEFADTVIDLKRKHLEDPNQIDLLGET
jgi:hypothetical protein